jgi:hypothetical protein
MAEIEGFRSGDEVTIILELDGDTSDPIKGMLLYDEIDWMDNESCWYFFHRSDNLGSWVDVASHEFGENNVQEYIENRGYTDGWRLTDNDSFTDWYIKGSIKSLGIKGRKHIPKFTFKKKPLDFVN